MEKESFKYFAFISYSHKDKKIAKRLQRRLESYHLPASVQKSYPELPKKLSPIFIDESNLVAKGTLKAALQANLDSSKYLIVICSPNSAKSEYVNEEVDYFIKSGRITQIIPLIVDGTPHSEDAAMECFTHALLALPRENEIPGIDLKKFGRRDAFLRVIATMLGLDLDSFISNEARERKRKIMIFTPIAAALVIAVGMLAWSSFNYFNFFSEDHPSAQFTIGLKYHINKDYLKAFEWCQKAAENGDTNAQTYIGNMYYYGDGVEQDYAKAMEWHQKAAWNGNASAQNNLGYLYEKGLGVKKNYKKAIEWYEKAAAQGHKDAQARLKELNNQ